MPLEVKDQCEVHDNPLDCGDGPEADYHFREVEGATDYCLFELDDGQVCGRNAVYRADLGDSTPLTRKDYCGFKVNGFLTYAVTFACADHAVVTLTVDGFDG